MACCFCLPLQLVNRVTNFSQDVRKSNCHTSNVNNIKHLHDNGMKGPRSEKVLLIVVQDIQSDVFVSCKGSGDGYKQGVSST